MSTPFTNNSAAYASSTFLGAKVRGFTTSLGWGAGSPSQLTVDLVDDPTFDAAFSPPDVGTPVYFSAGSLSFNGLFQKWERKRDTSGNPLYQVVVQDPREILEGTQVIIGGYNGPVGAVKNLFNAYGYWENQAYGASGVTEAGMPWFRIRDAVRAMSSSPAQGAYGGPLTFRGYTYSLDLSQIPQPPSYYRLGGASVGLLDAIAQICEDAGCDFFIELVGFTIRVRVVSRAAQPPLGTITAVTEANAGTTIEASNGLECRNELTSAFLVGGDVSSLLTTDAIRQFWGYDVDGNPILGRQILFQVKDAAGNLLDTIPTEEASLNAAPVAGLLGDVIYPCTTLEMRFAQANMDSWLMFMSAHRPALAKRLKLPCPFLNQVAVAFGIAALVGGGPRPNFVNDKVGVAKLALQGDALDAANQMYEFVRGYADEYMGRKFVVALPFVLQKVDPETLKVTTSWEVADAGYVQEGAEPLGLSPLNADKFRGQDGRFRALMVFGNILGIDISKVSPQSALIENGLLYQECQVDPQLISVGGAPCVVASLGGPVVQRELDPQGDPRALAALMQVRVPAGKNVLKRNALPFKIAPLAVAPVVSAVPLKSNVLTYGPWYASGAPGKVRFEQDNTLTPWSYGGYGPMGLAGASRVNNAITNMQVCETGAVELAGAPTVSLGDVLQAGGPNVTAMDVSYGVGGVKTNYRFQTFTPRFGMFSKAQTERMKRLALAGVELRKGLRAALRENAAAGKVKADAARADKAWRAAQAKALKKETPHDVFHAFVEDDPSGDVRFNAGLTTMEESISLANADSTSDYRSTAIMGLGGLVRPFSTGPSSLLMPKYVDPEVMGNVPSKTTLDPWKAKNDVEVFSYGSDYAGLHAYRRGVSGSDARLFGLRGPLVVVGWGYGLDTKCVPGDENGWDADHLTRMDKQKAGPVDLLWDERRGVWTCHGVLKGSIDSIASGGSGTMSVSTASGAPWDLTVYNHSDVAASGSVLAGYVASDNRWYVMGAEQSSPLTTKGDIFTFSNVATRLPAGSDGQVLTSDSSQTTGLKWATPGGGSSISSGESTFSGIQTISSLNTWTNTSLTLSIPSAGTYYIFARVGGILQCSSMSSTVVSMAARIYNSTAAARVPYCAAIVTAVGAANQRNIGSAHIGRVVTFTGATTLMLQGKVNGTAPGDALSAAFLAGDSDSDGASSHAILGYMKIG